MLQITLDPSSLTKNQREAIAGFLLTFPSSDSAEPQDESVSMPGFTLTEDNEEQSPEEAFGPPPQTIEQLTVRLANGERGVSKIPDSPETRHAVAVLPTGLDKDGLPWDDRIHSSSKAKNADGSWRLKRGVDTTLVTAVERELKALMGLPGPVNPTLAGAVTITAPAIVAQSDASAITQSMAGTAPLAPPPAPAVPSVPNVPPPPPPASAPVAEVPPPPPTVNGKAAYISLVGRVGAAIAAGKITQVEINQVTEAASGIPSLSQVPSRLDLLPQVEGAINALIG